MTVTCKLNLYARFSLAPLSKHTQHNREHTHTQLEENPADAGKFYVVAVFPARASGFVGKWARLNGWSRDQRW